jgi:hypothetical protein
VAQKHDRRLPKPAAVSQDTWSAPHAISAVFRTLTLGFSVAYRHLAGAKFPKPWSSCESRANLGAFAGSDLLGVIKDATGSYPLALLPLVALSAAGSIAVLLIGHGQPRIVAAAGAAHH